MKTAMRFPFDVYAKRVVLLIALMCLVLVKTLSSISAAPHAMQDSTMSGTAECAVTLVHSSNHVEHHGTDVEGLSLRVQSEDITESSDCAMVSCCGHWADVMVSFESSADFSGLVYANANAIRVTDRKPFSKDKPPKHL